MADWKEIDRKRRDTIAHLRVACILNFLTRDENRQMTQRHIKSREIPGLYAQDILHLVPLRNTLELV
jgi:hypothetical protein